MSSQRSAAFARRLRSSAQEAFVIATGEKSIYVTSLGRSKLFLPASGPGQSVSRRWLHSLGLLRPRAADYTITRSVLDRYGTSRQGIHEIARRVGSGSARRALLQNVGGRRGFCSENGKKKGNFENFYPKNRKDLPKGRNEQKAEQKSEDPKQEGDKFFTDASKSQMQSLLATGAATVAILMTLSERLYVLDKEDGMPNFAELERIMEEFDKKSNSLYTILRSSKLAGSQRAPFLRQFLLRLNYNSFLRRLQEGP